METLVKAPTGAPPWQIGLNIGRLHYQGSIYCARKRSKPFISQRASKLMLHAALTVATNLNIVPPSMTALIRDLGGGSGGGMGRRRSGGGGGFGWGRRRAANLGFALAVVVVGLGLCAGGKVKRRNDVALCGLGLGLVGAVMNLWNVRIADWVLGFGSCAGVVGVLGMRRDKVTKLVDEFRAFVPFDLWSLKMFSASRNRRRAF